MNGKKPGARPALFITGIPTAGKSYLARRLIRITGGYCLETDNLFSELAADPRYRPAAEFFLTQDESEFYAQHRPQEQWEKLVAQYETLWPAIRERIRAYEAGHFPFRSQLAAHLRQPFAQQRPLVFEGISLLPRLARRDLSCPGLVLVGKSFDQVLQRNRERPRWGKSEELIRRGAEAFWFGERPRYIAEARSCGYPVFEDADEAYLAALRLLRPDRI